MRLLLSIAGICAVSLCACGGGSAPVDATGNGGNSELAANEPTQPELTDDELFALERLKNLKRIAAEAEAKFPGLSDYHVELRGKKGKSDGADAFLAAAARYEAIGYSGGDEPWRGLLAWGPDHFETANEREPTKHDLQEALDHSAGVAEAIDSLKRHDTIFALGAISDDDEKSTQVLKFLMSARGRIPILVAVGFSGKAAAEMTALLDVLSKLDARAGMDAMYVALHIRTLLAGMATQNLAPMAAYPEVVAAIEKFRQEPVVAFKRAWRYEFSEFVSRVLKARKPEDIWQKGDADVHGYEWIEFHISVSAMHSDLAPNPYDSKQYLEAKEAAGKAGGRRLEEAFASQALHELRGYQYWLAWDLSRADAKSPLLGRRDEADKMISDVPYLTAEWSESELTIKLTDDCPLVADSGLDWLSRTITVKLRPKQ